MVGILEVGKISFEQYKKDIVSGILYGLAALSIGVLFLIPILGAFIWAYLMPKVLNWYYNKTIGNIRMDDNLAFKVWLIYGLIVNILVTLVMFLFGISKMMQIFLFSGNYFALVSSFIAMLWSFIAILLIALIVLIFGILYSYTLYASVLGKISEVKLYPGKSLILTTYLFVWSILLGIVATILALIPLLGGPLVFLYNLFFFVPIFSLIAANFVLSS